MVLFPSIGFTPLLAEYFFCLIKLAESVSIIYRMSATLTPEKFHSLGLKKMFLYQKRLKMDRNGLEMEQKKHHFLVIKSAGNNS